MLILSTINTPLGEMRAGFIEGQLTLLRFTDEQAFITKFIQKHDLAVIETTHQQHQQLQQEMNAYFQGKRQIFSQRCLLLGSTFQKKAWLELQNIAYGKCINYQMQSTALGNPRAYRAVANANANNPISIIIPCHRVIHKNGTLAGYTGGIKRKKALLALERFY